MRSGSTARRNGEAWVQVPDPDASVEDVLEFAGTYDAYAFFADQPDQLQRLLGGVYDEIARSLVVPEWVRLDDAGPTLCFVGLNPATGDTDGKPRPTLAKVVNWARREGCGAVVVVNLFAYRATNPRELLTAGLDIVGEGNDEMIRQRSAAASVTLAAWGAHRLARSRAADVLPLLTSPRCVGVTKSGAPAHPLYIPSATRLRPYP